MAVSVDVKDLAVEVGEVRQVLGSLSIMGY